MSRLLLELIGSWHHPSSLSLSCWLLLTGNKILSYPALLESPVRMQTAAVFTDTIQDAAKHDSTLGAEQQAFVKMIVSRGTERALNVSAILKSKPCPYAKAEVPHGNMPWDGSHP